MRIGKILCTIVILGVARQGLASQKYRRINGRLIRVISLEDEEPRRVSNKPWVNRSCRQMERITSGVDGLLFRVQYSIQQHGMPPISPILLTGAALTVARALFNSREPVGRAIFFWRRSAPIIVHYRFTQWWLTTSGASRDHRDFVYNKLHDRYAGPAQEIILHLSGLFCKIGQVLSTRPDFIPPQYIERFAVVQDSMPQWPIEKVLKIMGNSLKEDFGLSVDDVFESIEAKALGSASIGQAHRGTLRERYADMSGGKRDVAIKVMHPESEGRFAHDFQVFRWLCRIALPGWRGLLDELERQMMTEFDYRNEAISLERIRSNLMNSPFRDKVHVPFPVTKLCTKNVLVMEMLHGRKLVDAVKDEIVEALGSKEKADRMLLERRLHAFDTEPPLLRSESIITKGKLLMLREKCRGYINLLLAVHGYEILVDGLFNGDPHFGNVLVLNDGKLGLIDYGQTRSITDHERTSVAKVIAALANHEAADKVSVAMKELGFETKLEDADTMMKYAKLFFDSDHEGKQLGYATPQLYFASLMRKNQLIQIPDAAVFIARVSFLFRGLGSAMGLGAIHTSQKWKSEATQVLKTMQTSM